VSLPASLAVIGGGRMGAGIAQLFAAGGAEVTVVEDGAEAGQAARGRIETGLARAAERGFIGFAFTNADSLVKAYNARTAVFGTNPICFAAPLRDEGPLCLDMATSVVSWNKVRVRHVSGLQLQPDWAYDADGAATIDPALARSLSPTGGYKGYGLGMMVEILCGLIAGGPIETRTQRAAVLRAPMMREDTKD